MKTLTARYSLLKSGLLILLVMHFTLSGMIPYVDLLGYILVIAGIYLLKDVFIKSPLILSISLFSIVISIVSAVFSYGEPPRNKLLGTTAGIFLYVLDLLIIYLLCKSIHMKGLELKNIEICSKALQTIYSVIITVVIIIAYNLQFYFTLEGSVSTYVHGFLTICLFFYPIYFFWNISLMLNVSKNHQKIYSDEIVKANSAC